jgi:hypothetical protein
VLRDADVPFVMMDGARTRGVRGRGLVVRGVVWHCTVTPPTMSDKRVAELLRDGHSTLSGPLSQVGVRRSGVWDIIALGRCNHNGYGEWGNDSLGLEFYNTNMGEPFTAAQMETGERGTAAVLKHLGLPPAVTKGHKETDPNRKTDPRTVNMPAVRLRVHERMTNKELFTVGQYEDIVARLNALQSDVDALAKKVMPLSTQQEEARNVKRIGHKLDIPTIEGGDPDA